MTAISIIIPLYNKVEFINETVGAFLVQVQFGDEVIIVDDVSTDGSYEAIQDLKSDYLRLIRLEVNSGPATARNRGAEMATGDYLLFFDADDQPHPQLIATLKQAIIRHPSEAVFSFELSVEARGEHASMDTPVESKPALDVLMERDAYAKSCLAGRHLCTASSTCVRVDAFRSSGGFKSGLRACEDPELWVRLSALHPIVHLPMSLAVYRDVHGSLSYAVRGQPGIVQPYVETLMALSRSPGDIYHLLARATIMKNAVYCIGLSGRRDELRAYLRSVRTTLGLTYLIALLLFTYVPRRLIRSAFALRELQRAFGSYQRRFFSRIPS